MADPKNRCPAKGGAPPWRTEALLAAGFLAGSLTTRLRNPRLGLLLAAGALAWRALSPSPRTKTARGPMLALPEPSPPQIDPAPVCETIEHFAPPPPSETVPFMPEPLGMSFPPAPEVPASHFLATGSIEDALHAEHTESRGCDAWILGLEPLPVVEDLPEEPPAMLTSAGPAVPAVQEHRPVIAEGAPLPDMIEITIEPSAAGISMIQSFSQALPLVVNEGPVEAALPAPEPVIAQVVPETEHELTLLTELLEATTLAQPAPASLTAEPEVQAAPVAMMPPLSSPPELVAAVTQWEPPATDEAPLTLRPMPRTIKWGTTPEAALKPRQNLPSIPPETPAEEKAAETNAATAATAVLNTTRHIVPRAPASAANVGDQQKSWLAWWK